MEYFGYDPMHSYSSVLKACLKCPSLLLDPEIVLIYVMNYNDGINHFGELPFSLSQCLAQIHHDMAAAFAAVRQ